MILIFMLMCRTPTPPKNEKGSGGNALKFQWSNYTEHNQNYAVLSLKSHLDKFFQTDRYIGPS